MDSVGVSPQASTARNLDERLGLPPASSSSKSVHDIIETLRQEAENENFNLDAIIKSIPELLDAIKMKKESQNNTERSKKPQNKRSRLSGLLKVKDLLLDTVNRICALKDVLPAHAAKEVARDVIQGLGQAHWVTSGFLLIVYIVDRFETLSSNKEACLSLLKQMYYLAVDVRELERCKKGLAEAERPDDLAEAGTVLIVEGSLICFNQMRRKKRSRIFSTSKDQDELINFKEKFKDFHDRMLRRMSTWICSSLFCKTARRLRPRENAYPDHAVGIKEPLKKVTKLLELGSEERAVAVIVHGFGGIGKSTLADAVFARYNVKDCKYSVVRLDSSPEIANSSRELVRLQRCIIRDLMSSTEEGRTSEGRGGDENILELYDFQDGRRKIGELLKKEVAFLYIDNVEDPQTFEDLLPTRTLKDAKELRLLITTRNNNVLNKLGNIRREVHEMQPLHDNKGTKFLMKEMCNVPDDIKKQITGSDMVKNIVEISGGVPKLLELMIGFILSEPKKIRESYDIVIKGRETFTGDAFIGTDKYIFAYDGLPAESKNPFLDICYFFKGWEWETVANIVGESQLIQLERRALVSKKKDMISLNDVILTMGKQKAQDTRFDFTNADALQKFFKKDMEDLKLVKGLWFSNQACKIPVDSLDSMNDSLRIFGHKMALEEGQCGKPFHKLLAYKGETPELPFEWAGLENIRFLSYRPQSLALLPQIPSSNLKHIELDGSLCSESEILTSHIQQLQALQVLRLIDFRNLKKLPGEWGEHLSENLKELTLSKCTAMKQLTGSISQLKSLRILKLDNCCNLRRFPTNCESLSSSLQKLNIWNCVNLKSLPSSFEKALDSPSRSFVQSKGILSGTPQYGSDSDYESDEEIQKGLLQLSLSIS